MRPPIFTLVAMVGLLMAESSRAAAGLCAVPDAKHATIQSAADDPKCSEIQLGARIYSEQLTLNRSGGILIYGVGAGRTVLASPTVRARSTVHTTYLPNYTYVIQVKPGTSATLRDLTVDGASSAKCTEHYFGVRFTDASGELERVVIENVRGRGTDFACTNIIGIGVTSEGAMGSTPTLTLHESTIRAFQQIGALANGNNASLVIDNSVFHGSGPQSSIVQTGVQIAAGATANLTRTTLSDLKYTGDPCNGVGTAVKFAAAGQAIVSDSVLRTNDRGIYLSKNTSSAIAIKQNRFVETLGGVLSTDNGSGKITIANNAFISTQRSTAATVATCFNDSGDAIAVNNEQASIISGNSAADSSRCAVELLTGTSNLDVQKNKAVRSSRSDIEDTGTMNRLTANLCTTSAPAGICSGSP